MKARILICTVAAVLAAAAPGLAVVNVTVDPGAPWLGFMNVFETPENGGGYVFGSAWAPADLTAVFTGPVLTLGPNSINDPSSFWYTPSGGPGAVGNKIMDANMYIENDALAGETVTFSGLVISNTFTEHTSVAFIKDFTPDYSSFVQETVALTPGPFSISLATTPGHHIQYGFETMGRCVWITDVAPYGTAQVMAPEPASLALLGLAGVFVLRRR
jgi:hypothetical protein